jgi:hypothetical protein
LKISNVKTFSVLYKVPEVILFWQLVQATEWEFHGEKFHILPAGGGYQSCQQLINDVITNKVFDLLPLKPHYTE